MSRRLKRRELPLVAQLPRKFFPIELVREEFAKHGLDKFQDYGDLSFKGVYKHLCEQHLETVHSKFMTPNELENSKLDISERDYIQLALTDFDNVTHPDAKFEERIEEKMTRIKASMDPTHEQYNPILDERNYSKRNEHVKGIFADMFDSFKAKITRSRFAVLMPGAEGKLHTDYDTDYSVRVHYPIYTNEDCKMGFVYPGQTEAQEFHLPADGHFYFINQGIPHYVYNRSNEPRIHLVITLEAQDDL